MPKVDTPGQTGLAENPLSNEESAMLEMFFQRGLVDLRSEGSEVTRDFIRNYRGEIEKAARVAKAEFDKQFDGESPESGKFGVSRIRAGYFGWNSWDNCPNATLGSTTTWIDDGVPDNLSGGGGNPATVGDAVVHLITAVGTHEVSPKVESVTFRLNDQPRPSVETEWAFRETDTRYKPLTTPLLLKEDDDIEATFYGSASGSEALYLDGVTFIQEKDSRELDPANMAGTSLEGNIIVQ